jgi:ATP dependent DNA ligase domain
MQRPLAHDVLKIAQRRMIMRHPSGFIEPCQPSKVARPPSGSSWVHEIKHDGYRLMVRKDGARVRCFTRNGHDWADRFPAIVEGAARVLALSFLTDGEAVIARDDGAPDFHALRSQRRRERFDSARERHIFQWLSSLALTFVQQMSNIRTRTWVDSGENSAAPLPTPWLRRSDIATIRIDPLWSFHMLVRPRDLADQMSRTQLEIFTLPLEAARCKAREIINQRSQIGSTPIIENWRQLADGQIEFSIRHFPAAD